MGWKPCGMSTYRGDAWGNPIPEPWTEFSLVALTEEQSKDAMEVNLACQMRQGALPYVNRPIDYNNLSNNQKLGYATQPEAALARSNEFKARADYVKEISFIRFPGFAIKQKRRSK
jgi:hypothetical protein